MIKIFNLLLICIAISRQCIAVESAGSNVPFKDGAALEQSIALFNKMLANQPNSPLEASKAVYLYGYLSALIDANVADKELKYPLKYSLPEDTSPVQLSKVIDKFLHDNSDKLEHDASYLIILALHNAYPVK